MANVLPPLREPAAKNTNMKKTAANALSGWGGVETMITSYSIDFGKKGGTPAAPRPCSATRRNRPHPSQYFMNWRMPSKPVLDGRSPYIAEPKSTENCDILQNFYEEYRGKDEPKRNVQSPNICKEINEDEHLKLMERLKISGKPVETIQLPLPQLNDEALSIVADLFKKATPQEQEVLEKAFAFRDKDSQDLPTYTFISPEAIKILEQVLQKAGITDNDSAIQFLLSVGQVIMSLSHSNAPAPAPAPAPTEERLRRPILHSPKVHPFPMPKHKDAACGWCSKSRLASELRDISDKNAHWKKVQNQSKRSRSYLENIPRLPKLQAFKKPTPGRTKAWHSMPVYPPQGKVENKLATFLLPHRPIPRTFTIHPEWD